MQNIKQTEIAQWLEQLEKIPTGSCSCPSFLKPFHFVTIGLAVKKAGWETMKLPEDLMQYAARMKLWDAINLLPPCNVSENQNTGKFLPVQAFLDNQQDVSHITDELTKIILNTASKEIRESLTICLTELINNFFDHAGVKSDLPCLVCAQSWPKGKLIQVAIADAGIGIRDSLIENNQLITRLENENSCKIASEYGVTSKPQNDHSGYGLTLAKDLMIQANGTYILASGNEIYSCSKNSTEFHDTINSRWNGTILVLEWKIDEPLDSKSIYDSWPVAEGYSDEDFF
ncbi:hypothetical protein ELY21_00950 [Legionella sp. km535]|uniref:hypothetical protein n=1 Tax=Legionella sp. km535 TaxID=2498107 RepID=UPI000F8ECA43|nr:hypothetical protein [Legionella sp. km535]RUR20683.1 hypothetical protein ELY21_00950 [Legionella sp. km535]